MSKSIELIPIGIDLGSIHARIAIGNLAHNKTPAIAEGLVDSRLLPDIISNAQGDRYTLALVGTDNTGGEDGENNGAEGQPRHIFGEAARRSLARESKPAISKDPSPTVRELIRSSLMAKDDDAPSKASKASAFFSHLADLACDASSSYPSKLRSVISVPVASTAEEQSAIVRAVERGINDALLARLTTKEAKQMRKEKDDEDDPFVIAIITDPAAVCIAHGLTETEIPRVIDLALTGGTPSNHWKHALVIDWGSSGLTATHVCKKSTNSSIITIERHITEIACSGTAIVSTLAAHCASMFERKSKVSGVLDSKKAFHRLEVACESAVRTLSRAPTVTVAVDGLFEGIDMNVPISRPRFDMLMSGILRQAETVLTAFAIDNSGAGFEFDVVLLAGNVCDMPSATNLIRNKLFPTANTGRADVPPDEVVAIGCARHAASILSCDTHSRQGAKSAEGATRKVKGCPLTIGICRIEVGKENGQLDDVISTQSIPMIEVGEPLPANVTRTITYTNGEDSWLLNSYVGIVQMQGGAGGSKSKLIGKIDSLEGTSFELAMELSSAGKLTVSVNGGPSAVL